MNRHDNHFNDNWEKNFDKNFKRAGSAFAIFWVISAIVSLAFTGVLIWGLIELVQWVTTK